MPKGYKMVLPEEEIVRRWLNEPATTTYSLGSEHGCSFATITLVLRRHLSPEILKAGQVNKRTHARTRKGNWSHSEETRTKLREKADEWTPEFREAMRERGRNVQKIAAASRRGTKHSPEARAKMSEAKFGKGRGAENHNWRGGTSRRYRRGQGWVTARNAARERDGNTCQSCGKTGEEAKRNMDVHHRRRFHDFDNAQEANHLDNLVCLCMSCHRRVEWGKIPCP
ncbi:HNH endonuclease [bacterium]|nr:MAG: HNH endonuclease [bacterium]